LLERRPKQDEKWQREGVRPARQTKSNQEDTMANIGIIGAGVAGLHLGLFLRKYGIAATIYTEKAPTQLLGERLANVVARFAPTRERERLLGINYWDSAATDLKRFSIYIGGERSLQFAGDLERPANIVDMRIYCARLLEEFAMRGGQVVIGAVQASDIQRIGVYHDLMVVAAGRGSLANLFARRPEHSPYSTPQRLVIAGFYRGVAYPQPVGFDLAIAPGHGEILSLPLFSFEPGLTGILFEIKRDGAFEALRHMRYEDDPSRFHATVLGLLRNHAPMIYARLDPHAFALARPLDLCHTAITPTVRRGYVRLPSGMFAVALGDAHVVIDPLIGQGANTASHSAWVLGEAIRDSRVYDEGFCERVEQQICAYALVVSEYSNSRLLPPPPHMGKFMIAAARDQAIANIFANGVNHPDRLWEIVSSPERTAALLEQFGGTNRPGALAAA
jgi:2-polyprenyl-6-methoxyphenol hydroxylase-like FAD-dependent oxidoreductase